ncbi:hypothetical protein [Candidatus Amarolinea dominans]|uniref:hypothetical protein n=1 Tax=Candidatus Amarolinea dominans TaxID=3140696 RepID=UPI001DAEACB6|nr:hypothetical protein [Anaerolineae bacterium]
MLNRASRVWAILLVLALCLSVLALGASAAGGPKSDAGTGAQLPQRTEAAPQAPLADFSEGFEDITLLPGLGWASQNNSSPLGSTGWFQGNDTRLSRPRRAAPPPTSAPTTTTPAARAPSATG